MEPAKRLSDPTLFRQQAYVNGAWIDATRGGKVSVSDPATGAVIETVPDMGSNETRAATEAAGESPSANFLGRARRWVCRPSRNWARSRSTRRARR